MKTLAMVTVVLAAGGVGALAGEPPAGAFQDPAEPAPRNVIDEVVFAPLRKLGIPKAKPASDAVFLRRAYLDVIGTLPTEQEARQFLATTDPHKRSALIDRLLERKEFAVYVTMKWGDLLRIKAEFPINLWPNAVQAYNMWIWSSLRQDMAYDRFVREQLTSCGSNFRVPPVNFFRATRGRKPEALAKATALTFMGARAEKWDKKRLAGMAGFFAYVGYKSTLEWKEEIVYFDSVKAAKDAAAGKEMTATFPDGTSVRLSADKDPRQVFADWLITPENPWFARSIVNRVWYWLLGRGIVHEPDDLRADNPPVDPELLEMLAKELVDHHYDLKHVYRLILNSQTYQLSSVPSGPGEAAEAAEANFACYCLRRLEAEVLIDALCQITGSTEEYSSRIPEPYTWIPEHHRSISLPDGSITSPFLEMFGRPPRDTGLEAERSNTPTAAQRLHLLNSSHILSKISSSRRLSAMMQDTGDGLKTPATRLYLAILSRMPTEEELKTVEAYSAQSEETRGKAALIDLTWALINSSEFLYRH